MLQMEREKLITKEMMENHCSKPSSFSISRSINEDIELLFENLQLRRDFQLMLDTRHHHQSNSVAKQFKIPS